MCKFKSKQKRPKKQSSVKCMKGDKKTRGNNGEQEMKHCDRDKQKDLNVIGGRLTGDSDQGGAL